MNAIIASFVSSLGDAALEPCPYFEHDKHRDEQTQCPVCLSHGKVLTNLGKEIRSLLRDIENCPYGGS